jgi:hypothetical protein
MRYWLVAAALLAVPAAAQDTLETDIEDAFLEENLRSDVEALVGMGTRHTLSEQDDPRRGIGAAILWGRVMFTAIGGACGACLEVVEPERMVTGDRIPTPTRLVDVIAIQRGTERPNEVVIVQGHIDSRVSDVMNATSDAPGANDNASGSALVMSAARVLSQRKYPTTIVYALLSGEEQGLYGGELLADYARLHGWTVKAVLNNDIVGGSCGSDRHCDDDHVRVFSEGPRADANEALRADVRRNGGENDSPSRNLSRFIAGLDDDELEVRQIWRTDRMGRGSDHIPFLDAGYPAIRFSVAVEDYEHQHQDVRVENGITYGDTVDEMDFPYLAKVTRLNVRTLDALARSPMPPASTAVAAVQTFTTISWNAVPGAAHYRIYQRRTDEPSWPRQSAVIAEAADESDNADQPDFVWELEGVRGDDWLFGVSSVAADGAESPVASAVPGGAFAPID